MTHAIGKMANQIYETTKNDCSIYRSFEGVILPPRRPHLRNPVPRRIPGHQRSEDHRHLHRRPLPDETTHNLREPSYNELVAAVSAHLCPDETALRYALRARKAPLAAKNAPGLMHVAGMIAPAIQTYADVLEAELKKAK